MAKSAGDQIDFERLVEYQRDMHRGLERRKEKLQSLKSALTNLGHSPNYQGTTADAVRSYIDEVHVSGIINSLLTLIESFEIVLDDYVAEYPEVDGGESFRLIDQDYEALQRKIKEEKPKITPIRRSVVNTLDAVDDIISTSGRSKVSAYGASLEDHLSNMNHLIDDQQEKWGMYEVEHAQDTDDLQTMITKIRSMIAQYANGKQPTLDQYQAGGFAALVGQAFLEDMNSLAEQNRQSANMDRGALKLIQIYRKDQRDYDKRIAQQKAQEQQDRWSKVWVNGFFLAVGAALTVATAGAATPLVVAMTAVSTGLSASDLVGNIKSAQLNKDQAGLAEGFMQQMLGKKNGSTVYGSIELVTSVLGSGAAVTKLADTGYLVHGASKISVLDTYKTWHESGLGARMAWGAVKSNVGVMARSLGCIGKGKALTKAAAGHKFLTTGAISKVYGIETAKEVGKDAVNDKIDDAITDPVAKSIPTLGGKVIFRAGIKSFQKNEDKIWTTAIGGRD
ncbi:hypothetical protein AUQ39_04825 [Lacticaseibacillus casei]|nr:MULTISPECIES: T7SS effector LXG polymorphic toxin [Lacticaseibacillus]MDE3283911.1 LXG domain-containing protein [Lacticaseibacillus casei]OLS09955.1 hypothetical protein AUQ39_04825 [Lacticaseibacillus casei]QVI31408.1 hypothetical protein KG087_10840 [Lacticaseibacillus zeae]